jgi:ABC-type cobalamin transport system ATPase subunit
MNTLHSDVVEDDPITAIRVAYQKGRTMQDAFHRMCAETQLHATLDFMNHTARRARNAILNSYNRLLRKARKKGILTA